MKCECDEESVGGVTIIKGNASRGKSSNSRKIECANRVEAVSSAGENLCTRFVSLPRHVSEFDLTN